MSSDKTSEAQQSSRFEQDDQVVVMKFGGTSVEDAAAIKRLIEIVRRHDDIQPVVVVSALARVTDQLLEAGKAAAAGHLGSALAIVRNIYVRHEELADALVTGTAYVDLDRELRADFQTLESLLQRVESSRELDAKAQDQLLGFGECFSSQLVNAALCEAGLHATHVDARSCIVTDARHGQASPVWDDYQSTAPGLHRSTLTSWESAGSGRFHRLHPRRRPHHAWTWRIGFQRCHRGSGAGCIADRNMDRCRRCHDDGSEALLRCARHPENEFR